MSPHRSLKTARSAAAALAACLCLATGLASAADGPLRAGAATANVTPPLGYSINGNMSDGTVAQVHDELHARALVLDDGAKKVAFVVVDSCMIPRPIVAEAKRLIAERSKIPADHVLISATHAHSCGTAAAVFQSEPGEWYTRFLAVRIADAVERAARNLAPAHVGWGAGKNAEQVHNRRWRMKPGTIGPDPFGRTTDRVKMNPPSGGKDLVEPAGPIDPEVAVLSVLSPDGRPIALLANYSLHYVGGVGPGHASADYFGAFADRVQQLLGADRLDPPFVGIMSNGTSGDINNIDFHTPRPRKPAYGQIREVADQLAQEAVRVARALQYRDRITLDARAAELSLGVRKGSVEEVARAEALVEKARAKGPVLSGLDAIYAAETLKLRDYPDTVPVTIQAIRIGDLAIAAIPCEVFVEIGLKLKAESAIKPMFTISLANGYNGYLPTPEQHALGGYETWRARSSYLEVNAATAITARAQELLKALKEARRD